MHTSMGEWHKYLQGNMPQSSFSLPCRPLQTSSSSAHLSTVCACAATSCPKISAALFLSNLQARRPCRRCGSHLTPLLDTQESCLPFSALCRILQPVLTCCSMSCAIIASALACQQGSIMSRQFQDFTHHGTPLVIPGLWQILC